jgi:RecA/RadA recombinase
MKNESTIVCNLFGGPGLGKSTMAAGVFSNLKRFGVSCELVTEVAKRYTWSDRKQCLLCQPKVFGKQLDLIEMLIDKVDIIVVDSPILLSVIYNKEYPESFNQAVKDIFRKFNNVNVLLKREKPYVQLGRNQTEEEARKIDKHIEFLLETEAAISKRETLTTTSNTNGINWLTNKLVSMLNEQNIHGYDNHGYYSE